MWSAAPRIAPAPPFVTSLAAGSFADSCDPHTHRCWVHLQNAVANGGSWYAPAVQAMAATLLHMWNTSGGLFSERALAHSCGLPRILATTKRMLGQRKKKH